MTSQGKKKIRIGICARCDTGGLANLSYDFWKHITDISKELVILSQIRDNPYLYPKGIICQVGRPTLEEIDEFLKDIDIVLAFETPYNWNIFSEARKRGIKTILMPMYEWTDEVSPVEPDLYLCPSRLEYDLFPEPKKFLPVPVDRQEIPFKQRYKAHTFVFNNGGGGTGGRNGMEELLKAIPLVKSDVKFIIRSQNQEPPKINDKRVSIEFKHFQNRADIFNKGDVFLFPHKFDGLSLPIQEALSAGMPVLSTNFYPHNTYLPKKWLFNIDGFQKGQVAPGARVIDIAILNPKKIAQKVDEWANKEITAESRKADQIAGKISWENLKKEYNDLFRNI